MKFRIIGSVAVIALSSMILTSCTADKDSAGLEYMPDMYRSPAIEPYVDYGFIGESYNEELKMKLSAKVPPFGTIPFYGTDSAEVAIMLPYFRLPNISFKTTHGLTNVDFTSVDEYALAVADKNMLPLTAENAEGIFKTGKDLFMQNCAHCHGEKGDGNGPMVINKLYAGVPDYANLKNLSDGQMFYSIYYGRNMMGGHSSILNKKEIWTLVHYIRKFQDGNYGPGSEVVAPGMEADSVVTVAP